MKQGVEGLGQIAVGQGDEQLLGQGLEDAQGTQDDGAIGIDLFLLVAYLYGREGERIIAAYRLT